jgi:voltage-gated potassium channel
VPSILRWVATTTAQSFIPTPHRGSMAGRRRFGPVDVFVLLLAVASLSLVFYQVFGHPNPAQLQAVQRAEYAVVGLFLVEFLFALVRHEHRGVYLARNWYEVLALIPITGGPATTLPLFPALRVVVLVARFGRLFDRLYGDEAFHRGLGRLQAVVVEWVADAVTLRILDQTLLVLQKGAFTRNLADALEAHGAEMGDVVLEKVRSDPAMARVKHLPFFDDAVELSSAVTRRIAIEALRDPRMDELVREVIRANVKQIRDEVDRLESLKQTA